MSMNAVQKIKPPKFPGEIDDKKIEKAYKDFLKALEEVQKIAADTQKRTTAQMEAFGTLGRLIYDKSEEKNLDPKVAKALKALSSVEMEASDKVGRFMVF
jgi:hypothetical protein